MNLSESTKLTQLVNQALPALSNSSVTYNADRNMYLTTGYTSQSGHTYFQGIQLSDRLAIVCNIGRGGWGSNPLFLNAVTVYGYDGKEKTIIGRWMPSTWEFYSDNLAQRVAISIVGNYLKSQSIAQDLYVSDSDLLSYAEAQVKATTMNRNQISA